MSGCRVSISQPGQVSLKAGYNQNQAHRFLTGRTDIKLQTVVDLCEKGFGLDSETVLDLGRELKRPVD